MHPDRMEKRRVLLPPADLHQQSKLLLLREASSPVSTRVATYPQPGWRASSDIEGLTRSNPGVPTRPALLDGEAAGVCPHQKEDEIPKRGLHTAPANQAGPGSAASQARQRPGH